MKHRTRWMIAAALAALVVPQVAAAKMPADRVTVDGQPFASSAVAEAPVVANPWAGAFLDAPMVDEPAGIADAEAREVRFWMDEADGSTSLLYGFEFYTLDDGHAYVRLPGRGEELYAVNQSTIVRDAGWYRSSATWSALVVAHDDAASVDRWPLVLLGLTLGAVAMVGGYASRRLRTP